METLTVNQAMSKRAELKRLFEIKQMNVQSVSYNTIIKNKELDGTEFISHEVQDFEEEFNQMISLSDEIDMISTLIAKANSLTELEINGEIITVQNCLNRLSTYRKRANTIRMILRGSRESQERKVDASGTTPYYRITTANYDVVKMKESLEELEQDIMQMELAVDKANNDTVINIG